ncbi:MAG: succinate dehydrogenase cytochrome b subunit [Kiritimatiellae bacterium]|nr:succinate dehydrogenase cytochrome b subunit [Kiritimatiellia bacterium]MDW8459240.1 succinate dehydrogenase cytochrome b subunit [Verrucomicrobiota bacterium]
MSKPCFLCSSVGRKVVAAISGIALMLFIVVHLAGNLTLLVPDQGATFNAYAHKLNSLGPLLWVARAGLLIFFLGHVITAIGVRLDERRLRPIGYELRASKGGPSKQTWSSRSMLITGLILLVFVPFHIWMFSLNQGAPHARVVQDGVEMKDVYLAVVKGFKDPVKAWGYVVVMVLLGFHLRHGFWSSLQSLGALSARWTPAIYAAGLVFALLMAIGFLILPLYILYAGPDPATLRLAAGG